MWTHTIQLSVEVNWEMIQGGFHPSPIFPFFSSPFKPRENPTPALSLQVAAPTHCADRAIDDARPFTGRREERAGTRRSPAVKNASLRAHGIRIQTLCVFTTANRRLLMDWMWSLERSGRRLRAEINKRSSLSFGFI